MLTEVVMQVFHFSRYSALYCEHYVMLLLRRAMAFSRRCFFTTASAVRNCACTCTTTCVLPPHPSQRATAVSTSSQARARVQMTVHRVATLRITQAALRTQDLGTSSSEPRKLFGNVLAPARGSLHSLPSSREN